MDYGKIGRQDAFEEPQAECNELTTALLKCNTSMQVLTTESQAKPVESKLNGGVIESKQHEVIQLRHYQEVVIEQLKKIRLESIGTDDLKPGQFLAFMQGVPGAGKTTTAKKLADKLGTSTLFLGTTGTAGAQLKADTINKILKLGRMT